MNNKRYKELSLDPTLKLSKGEIAKGWRFCECEWDGMLVNINDEEGEGQFCHCFREQRECQTTKTTQPDQPI